MKLTQINAEQWKQVKEIYMEAFPKAERKPFFVLRHSVKSKKAQILTATEDGTLMGFVMVIPYGGMVMVDYLAVSSKIRSRGTGSQIMQQVCEHFADKRIVLLIERLDDNAENAQQRSASFLSEERLYFLGHLHQRCQRRDGSAQLGWQGERTGIPLLTKTRAWKPAVFSVRDCSGKVRIARFIKYYNILPKLQPGTYQNMEEKALNFGEKALFPGSLEEMTEFFPNLFSKK